MLQLRYEILKFLSDKQHNSILTAVSVQEMSVEISNKKPITIQKEIRKMLQEKLIEKGIQQGHAYTYYVTEDGLNLKKQIEK